MSYFFYCTTNIPDVWERDAWAGGVSDSANIWAGDVSDSANIWERDVSDRTNIRERDVSDRANIRERDVSECVKSTHSQIALRSIWATVLRFIRGGGAL